MLAELRARIARNLAAFEAQSLDGGGLRHAGIGVVLVPDDFGRVCFILTRRREGLRRHGGQWALPGGRLEDGETAAQAALREIHEEIGLELPPEAILGRLDDFISKSGHLITPFVVWADNDSRLTVSAEEVAAAYHVPLEDLDRPDALQLRPLLHFELDVLPTSVHAPTAAIIYQFREVALHGRHVRVADVEQPLFAWS